MDRRVSNAIFIIGGGALAIVLFLHFRPDHQKDQTQIPPVQVTQETETPLHDGVLVGGTADIPVTIADTQDERELGLSYTQILAPRTGKLFIFDTPGMYGFWMKDMNYSIDIVWMDKDLKILGVSADVSPDTYPQAFFPPRAALYVLEVNAHDAAALGLVQDMTLTLEKKF